MQRFTLTLTAVAFMLAAQGAQADVKTVSKVTVAADTASGPVVTHLVVTTSVQGDLARVETDQGRVVLYDLKARKVYWLDADHKTYSVVDIGEVPPSASNLGERLAGKTAGDVKLKADAQKKSVAGVDASRVVISGTLKTDNLSAGGNWGAGMGDDRIPNGGHGTTGSGLGGGIPLGGLGSGGDDDYEPMTTQISGDYWLSPAVQVTGSAVLPWFSITLPDDRATVSLLPQITQRMAQQMAGVPVASRVVLTTSNIPGVAGSRSVTVTTEMQSISTAPLDRTLFYQPADYRQAYPVPMTQP